MATTEQPKKEVLRKRSAKTREETLDDQTNLKILDFALRHPESTVAEMLSLLCQKAVLDPKPYGEWPREMKLMVGERYRTITFTFYYN